MIDRLPPQSLEAEQSVLGSILIDRDAVVEVAEFLRAEDFYRQAHGLVYAAMLDLFERREPIDIVTVAEVLERSDQLEQIGGRSYLSSLSNQTPTAVHAVQYARIVERKAVLRNLIAAAGRIAGIGYEDPAEIQEAIDRAEGELFAVSQRRVDAGFSQLRELLHAAYDRLDYLHAHRGEVSGIRSGFKELDTIGGLINQFKKVEGQVTHAEMGYSGIAADIQIKEDELNRLYEHDISMLEHIVSIGASIDSLKGSLVGADDATTHKDLMNIKARITDFEDQFKRRMVVIEGTEV